MHRALILALGTGGLCGRSMPVSLASLLAADKHAAKAPAKHAG